MRPNNANNRRSRGRGGRKSGNSRNQTFDSNGPGARVRGNASQIYEKYQQLARDAASSGDRVGAENFLQHAEHYYRLMIANGPKPEQRNNADGPQDDSSDGNRDDNESGSDQAASSENTSSDDGSDSDARRNADDANAKGKGNGNGNGAKPEPRERRARKTRTEDAESASGSDNETSDEVEASPA
jgi:hypothetical protein